MAEIRRVVYFSGRVQGVGFRQTAVIFSREWEVSGTVRNLPDGRVELDIEGPPEDVNGLIDRLREHFGTLIRNVEQVAANPRGAVGGVQIDY